MAAKVSSHKATLSGIAMERPSHSSAPRATRPGSKTRSSPGTSSSDLSRQNSSKPLLVIGPSLDLVSNSLSTASPATHSSAVDTSSSSRGTHGHGSSTTAAFSPQPPSSAVRNGSQRQAQQQAAMTPNSSTYSSASFSTLSERNHSLHGHPHSQHHSRDRNGRETDAFLSPQPPLTAASVAMSSSLSYATHRLEVGLENLGNTCFMNSALQCLLHIEPLVQYFLDGVIDKELNVNSPKKGVIARAFDALIAELMTARPGSVVVPTNFQRAVAAYAPYLMDYQQQDCQEFLRFVLDALSDDLARPHRRPAHSAVTQAASPDTHGAHNAHTPVKVRLQSPSALLPALPQISVTQLVPAKAGSHSHTHTPNHTAAEARAAAVAVVVAGTTVQAQEHELVLSDDEPTETEDVLHTSRTTPAQPQPQQPPLSHHTKLRVAKTVANVREQEHHGDGDSEAPPTQVAAAPTQPTPATPKPTQQPRSTMASTLSNTLRRMRGRVASDTEETLASKVAHSSDEDAATLTSSAATTTTAANAASQFAQGTQALSSDAKSAAERVCKEGLATWDRHLKLNDSVITDLFGGLLQSTTQCCVCGYRSVAFDPFLDLSVPIYREGESGGGGRGLFPALSALRVSGSGQAVEKNTLEKCLERFTAEEALDGDNLYHCEQCKKKRKCVKKMTVFRYPRVLVVHMKRFRFSHTAREKVSTDVLFPLNGLDLRPFLSPDVSAVLNQHGPPSAADHSSRRNQSSNNNHDEEDAVAPQPAAEDALSAAPAVATAPSGQVPTSSPLKARHKSLSSELPRAEDASKESAASTVAESLSHMVNAQWEPVYDLIGVTNHHGTLHRGHYFAHVQTSCAPSTENYHDEEESNANRWVCFNDERVSQTQVASIAGPTAYVLFYRLRENAKSNGVSS